MKTIQLTPNIIRGLRISVNDMQSMNSQVMQEIENSPPAKSVLEILQHGIQERHETIAIFNWILTTSENV